MACVKAEMVRNDRIGNDPAMEKLCIERLEESKQFSPLKLIPFEIDKDYVSRVRTSQGGDPKATFIAVETVVGSYLIECSGVGGRYGPGISQPENNLWHLIRPPQFQPSINTSAGIAIAVNRCLDAGVRKLNRPDLDHTSSYRIVTEVLSDSKGVRYRTGMLIGNVTVERFDVVTTGSAFYKTGKPDMDMVEFTCLFSPMLEVKALEFK
jgi:hypothetical protein